MTIKDIEFKLKDGRTAILRSANEKDAKAFIEYMKKSTGETDFLLRTPEECETQTIEQEIDFINNCNLYNYLSNFPHFIGFPACPLVK